MGAGNGSGPQIHLVHLVLDGRLAVLPQSSQSSSCSKQGDGNQPVVIRRGHPAPVGRRQLEHSDCSLKLHGRGRFFHPDVIVSHSDYLLDSKAVTRLIKLNSLILTSRGPIKRHLSCLRGFRFRLERCFNRHLLVHTSSVRLAGPLGPGVSFCPYHPERGEESQ